MSPSLLDSFQILFECVREHTERTRVHTHKIIVYFIDSALLIFRHNCT